MLQIKDYDYKKENHNLFCPSWKFMHTPTYEMFFYVERSLSEECTQ